MKACILLWLMVICSDAAAKVFDLREIYMKYHTYKDHSRDPLIDLSPKDRQMDREISLYFNTDFLHAFYWDNKILGITDRKSHQKYGNFRVVGWNFSLGVRVFSFLSMEYEHYSKHILDAEWEHFRPPVQDSYGIRLYLYQKKVPTLWNMW